jgi:hypothetical protein
MFIQDQINWNDLDSDWLSFSPPWAWIPFTWKRGRPCRYRIIR